MGKRGQVGEVDAAARQRHAAIHGADGGLAVPPGTGEQRGTGASDASADAPEPAVAAAGPAVASAEAEAEAGAGASVAAAGPAVAAGGPADPSEDRARDAEADARALASVLRMRILRLCLDEPRTNKEIADRLGRDPATTLHHVRTLARRGFLAAQPARRGARGAREVPYLATRKSWRAPRTPGVDAVLIATFLEEVAEAPPASVTTGRLGLRLDDTGWAEFRERLDALLEDFASRPPDPGGTPYSVFVALHEDAARRDEPAPPRPRTAPVSTRAPADPR